MQPLFGSFRPNLLPPHLRWHIPPSKDLVGKPLLLAGRPVALPTHRVGRRTWPCLCAFPALARECPHCERTRRITVWVPLLNISGQMTKIVLTGGSHTDDSIQKIKAGTVVECHYARVIRATLVFHQAPCQLGVKTFAEAGKMMDEDKGDITRWLLHYWQWPELTEWFGEQHHDSLKMKALKERAEYHGMNVFGVPVAATG